MERSLYIGLVLFGKKKKLFNVCQTFYLFNPLKHNCWNCLQKQNPQTYALYYLISSTKLPDAKSQLIRKDPDTGKDWGQEEKGTTEDEMVGWHHWLNGHENESESKSHAAVSASFWPHVVYSPWDSPGQNTGVGSLSLLQGIFPDQGSNPGLPHCRQILYQLSNKGNPRILEWVAYPFSSGSSWPRNWTGVSCIAGGFFTNWAIRESQWTRIWANSRRQWRPGEPGVLQYMGLQRVGHDWVAQEQNNHLTPSLLFLKDFFPFLCHPPSCFPSCLYSNSFLKDGLSLGPCFTLFCSHTTSLGNPIHSSVQPRSFSWLVCPPACWTFLWVYFMWDYYTMFMECFLCARNCPMSGKDLGTSHCPCLKENSHVSPFFPQSNPSVKVSPLLFSCSGSKSDPQKIWTSRTHECNVILKKSLCS